MLISVLHNDGQIFTLQEKNIVYVFDNSNNGTFVDGKMIGKGKMLPLANNAVLSLAEERHKGTFFSEVYFNTFLFRSLILK